jgi:hypothetical protein
LQGIHTHFGTCTQFSFGENYSSPTPHYLDESKFLILASHFVPSPGHGHGFTEGSQTGQKAKLVLRLEEAATLLDSLSWEDMGLEELVAFSLYQRESMAKEDANKANKK